MVRTKNQSCTWRACCQPVLKGHTPGEPNTIFLHVLCSGHCACSTHSLHHHRRRQIPTSTTPFVCTCASLLARTMPLPARALFSRRPDTCLLVPCLCRVRSVARVCHVITSGDPHTNLLRVSCSAHCTCYLRHACCFGCYHCRCGNTLIIPHALSLSLFCQTSTIFPMTRLKHAWRVPRLRTCHVYIRVHVYVCVRVM